MEKTFSNMIYCPWDVICYIDEYLHNEENIPKCYWTDTSDNAILRTFIDNYSSTIYDDFEILLNGGSIQKQIREDLTYDLLHSSENNFWSILFLTGYLTSDATNFLKYKVKSNAENGEGRSDVVIKDPANFRVVIFEVKHSEKKSDMEKDCDKALAQIVERQYAAEYEDEFDDILCYGISFYKKRCFVKVL